MNKFFILQLLLICTTGVLSSSDEITGSHIKKVVFDFYKLTSPQEGDSVSYYKAEHNIPCDVDIVRDEKFIKYLCHNHGMQIVQYPSSSQQVSDVEKSYLFERISWRQSLDSIPENLTIEDLNKMDVEDKSHLDCTIYKVTVCSEQELELERKKIERLLRCYYQSVALHIRRTEQMGYAQGLLAVSQEMCPEEKMSPTSLSLRVKELQEKVSGQELLSLQGIKLSTEQSHALGYVKAVGDAAKKKKKKEKKEDSCIIS